MLISLEFVLNEKPERNSTKKVIGKTHELHNLNLKIFVADICFQCCLTSLVFYIVA